MKTKINKSNLMKRAWYLFKNDILYSSDFSLSLRRAWEIEKANVEYQERKRVAAEDKARLERIRAERAKSHEQLSLDMSGAAAWYANAPRGSFFGD